MRILNVRRGFACNSSSSHSLIFRKGALGPDDLAGHALGEFGWQSFTLTSPEAKDVYWKTQLLEALKRFVPRKADADPYEERVELLKLGAEWGITAEHLDNYVDHQSVFALPSNFTGTELLKRFVTEFYEKIFSRPNLVVLGGNDGGDRVPTILRDDVSAGYLLSVAQARYQRSASGTYLREEYLRGRDDKTHFVLFNDHNGDKFRVTFDDNEPKRGPAPELVDVKVTDFCDFGCSYCYQGSTMKGKHAAVERVFEVLKACAAMRVFEVAFGGGEPTSHPDFLLMLRHAKQLGITPNFTTRNVPWVKEHWKELCEVTRAIAVSVDTAEEAAAAEAVWSAAPHGGQPDLQLQVVVGGVDTKTLQAIYKSLHHSRIMLLGWKATHRGATAKPKVCDWQSVVNKNWPLRCDTAFVDQNLAALSDADPVSVGAPEGTFSCYIDAVKGKMGASSYGIKYYDIEPFDMAPHIMDLWKVISEEAAAVRPAGR